MEITSINNTIHPMVGFKLTNFYSSAFATVTWANAEVRVYVLYNDQGYEVFRISESMPAAVSEPEPPVAVGGFARFCEWFWGLF